MPTTIILNLVQYLIEKLLIVKSTGPAATAETNGVAKNIVFVGQNEHTNWNLELSLSSNN